MEREKKKIKDYMIAGTHRFIKCVFEMLLWRVILNFFGGDDT